MESPSMDLNSINLLSINSIRLPLGALRQKAVTMLPCERLPKRFVQPTGKATVNLPETTDDFGPLTIATRAMSFGRFLNLDRMSVISLQSSASVSPLHPFVIVRLRSFSLVFYCFSLGPVRSADHWQICRTFSSLGGPVNGVR